MVKVFWPGDIILDNEKKNTLTVIDWEIVRRGHPALDVAEFAVEAYLLDRFRGGRGLLDACLKEYRRKVREMSELGVTVDRCFAKRFAVHVGVHLAFWPARVEWADKKDTKGGD